MNVDHTVFFYTNKSYKGLKYMTNFCPYMTGLVTLGTDGTQVSKYNTKQTFHRIY